MTRNDYVIAWRKSHGAPDFFLITWFLTVVYGFAKVFIALKFTPNKVTVFGGMVGLSAVWLVSQQHWVLAAIIALFSSLLDGVDGAVAEIKQLKSRFGSILDVVVDRIVELTWFMSFVFVGASIQSALITCFAILIMEYTRTKANSLGIVGPGAITLGERPTRVIMFVMLNIGVATIGTDNSAFTYGLWAMAGITIIANIQLLLRFTNQLRNDSGRKSNQR